MSEHHWRPLAGPGVAVERARMLGRAREFFAAKNVLEVDTPIMSRFAVTEPNIESLVVRSAAEPELFLQTSPEYKMKRLLAAGFGDIFQICKVFRDGELGRRHLPEFTMVEWYRLGFELKDMLQETIDFMAVLLDRPSLSANAYCVSYRGAFESALQIDPTTASLDELRECAAADAALRDSVGDDRDAWLDLLFATKVAPEFPADRLSAVYHYPASQAALARLNPDDSTVADRFELFFGELELGNGFVELCDANEQLSRFECDRELRRIRGQANHAVDPDFIAALQAGLPPCAGVAVGFDRALLLQQGAADIAAVSHFIY
jgi:lysyl-tRNA synthetase class 2